MFEPDMLDASGELQSTRPAKLNHEPPLQSSFSFVQDTFVFARVSEAEEEAAAAEAATIAACLAMAVAPAVQGAEEEPENASLSSARAEQLKQLFDLFEKNKDGSIDVALLDQVSIKQGPNETKVLSSLKDMDADKDGKLTFDEMKAFFAAVGASLNEDEFKLIVTEMFETVEASQLATQLAAQVSEAVDDLRPPARPQVSASSAASSCRSTAGASAGAAGRRNEGWEMQAGGQEPLEEEGGQLEARPAETEAPNDATESGSGSEPLQWQVRLQSAVSAAVETRAGEPLALIAHLLRHAPPSSEDSAAEYATRHGLPAALEAAVRGAGLEGPFALPAAAARAQAATDRLADAIASEQLRRTQGAAQRPGSPGGAAEGAARRPQPSRQRQRRRLPEALEELQP